MTVVTQYKLHKFLTGLAEKEDLDVFVASKWKQRLTIILGIVVGTFTFGVYGLVIGKSMIVFIQNVGVVTL